MTVQIGQVLDGKYRIVRLIGQGGMGAVYEGLNQLIDRRVAIKVMLPDIGAAAVGRFEQEARAAGRIGNDHILEILDMGRLTDGAHYMVMEFLDGESLESRLEKRGRLEPAELAPIALQLLAGLGAAHRAGVLHRDLKPDNVFLVREKAGHRDFVKLIDFGISKFAQDTALNLTKTGTMVGTPYYMSPEQARGKGPVDARADLYAVGVILYQVVSGRLPFEADTFNDLLFKIVLESAPPVSVHVPSLEPKFAAIVEKAMAREAGDRYQTAEELSEALATWMYEFGISASPASMQASYGLPTSRGPTPTPRGATPLPMATMAVGPTGALPIGSTLSASSSGRGLTPATPNTFGRTAADLLDQPVAPTSGWSRPALWGSVAFGVTAIALGAFLLMPGSDGPTAETPVEAGPPGSSPAAAAAPFHGDQFRPEVVKDEAAPAAPAPPASASPSAAVDHSEPATPEPSKVAPPTSKKTPKASPATTKPSAPPAPASKPAAPASSAGSDQKDPNKRFYFGY